MDRVIIGLLLVVTAGCATPSSTRIPAEARDGAAELLAVDRQFSADAAAMGLPKAFAMYADAQSRRVTPDGPMPSGPSEFFASLSRLPAGATMTWSPREAGVSRGGDMGWTWGDYHFRPAPGSRAGPTHGRYVTVWHRTGEGVWRITLDVGTDAPGP
jgi:ketosteroid isomerase-like protein